MQTESKIFTRYFFGEAVVIHKQISISRCNFVHVSAVLSCVERLIFPHEWKIHVQFQRSLSLSFSSFSDVSIAMCVARIVFQLELLFMNLYEHCYLVSFNISPLLGLRVINPSFFWKKNLNAAQTIKLIYFPGTLSINTIWQNEISLTDRRLMSVRVILSNYEKTS